MNNETRNTTTPPLRSIHDVLTGSGAQYVHSTYNTKKPSDVFHSYLSSTPGQHVALAKQNAPADYELIHEFHDQGGPGMRETVVFKNGVRQFTYVFAHPMSDMGEIWKSQMASEQD